MLEFEYGALPYKPVTGPSSEGVARVCTLVHTGKGPEQVLLRGAVWSEKRTIDAMLWVS